ncbi:MAG: ribonuclease H-like domain-containing protein [Acidobacteriia bacterium]|nr:ribonuclease H-like domain-containing protein [Terriglobia bacterium]
MRRTEREEWSGQLSLFDDDSARQAPTGRNVVVFDLETQRSFQDVGGRTAMRDLGMSIGVVYSFRDDTFRGFVENESDALINLLRSAELVVGFNLLGFDYEVLKGYKDVPFETLPTLDIMFHLQDRLGFRPKLDSVVQATLGAGKSADGLQALTWWKEGRLDLIEKYCTDDVRLTRDLYLYGRRNRHVLVSRYSGGPIKVDVDW